MREEKIEVAYRQSLNAVWEEMESEGIFTAKGFEGEVYIFVQETLDTMTRKHSLNEEEKETVHNMLVKSLELYDYATF